MESGSKDGYWYESDLNVSDGSHRNGVNYLLTGGNVELGNARFWLAVGASIVAGFLALRHPDQIKKPVEGHNGR